MTIMASESDLFSSRERNKDLKTIFIVQELLKLKDK